MSSIANYILPVITLIVIIYALYKKINIYEEFINGVKDGLKLSLNIYPSIFAFLVSVSVLVKSNIINDILSYINISLFPKEIIPLAVLRPISSSSSIVLLNDILKVHGPDSIIGMISSIIVGSTDTTIYIIAIYFSSVKIKKVKQSLVIGLLADLACVIISVILVYLKL